jgi:LPXTG-motif cell wall-anchored protein
VTVFNRSLRRPGALIAVAAAGVLGVGLSAGTASAHTPTWSIDCSSVSVDLTAYGHGNDEVNSVNVKTADGTVLLDAKFGDSIHKKLDLPKHNGVLTVHLSVKAADGDQYSKEEDKSTPPNCADQTTPPATPTPSASTPTEKPTESTPPASSAPATSAAAVPAPSKPTPAGDDLAETGSSSSTPMIAGAAAVVVVAGAGILWASRKRRAAQH